MKIIASLLILLASWWLMTQSKIIHPLLLPSPEIVGLSFLSLLSFPSSERIWEDLFFTIARAITGLLIGTVIGLAIGLFIGYFQTAYQLLIPWIDFLRSIPATALIPLVLLLFGLGEGAKIALVVFVVALLITVQTFYGVRNAHPTRILIAKTMHLSKYMMTINVLLPEALPYIAVGFRIALSLALVIVIVSEMFIGTTRGLGLRIIEAQLVYRTDEMYAVIILTGITGHLLNRMYILFEHKFIHWMKKAPIM